MAEIEKLDLKSMDIKETQLAKLRELFPEIFTEGNKIDWERLKLSLGEDVDTGKERYGMNWPGKADCYKTIQQPSIATLVPAREESVDFETTQNLFIEGDNLEVLKLLQKSYLGKIKLIYIDPPYNTGNDFIYPDNYTENLQTYLEYTGQVDSEGRKFGTNTDTDGRFHSKWMNMMYPRLFLAKNLLKEDGIIIISIDDSEVNNLKWICNEVFGEENFLTSLIWKHTQQSKNDEPFFSRHYNYQIVYRKSDKLDGFTLPRTEKDNVNYSNPDNDINGPWRSGDVRSPNYRRTLVFDLKTPNGNIIKAPENGWRWTEENIKEKIKSGEIVYNDDQTKIIRKIYLKNQEGRTPENIWDGDECGTTRDANSEIKDIFEGKVVFDTPKPSKLIMRFLSLFHNEKNFIALDFFAGSCSLAHAILKFNSEDQGKRKFVCIQLPEQTDEKSEAFLSGYKTIAEIGKERIRRVGAKIKAEMEEIAKKPKQLEIGEEEQQLSPIDLGFKVYKLAPSNFKLWDPNVEKTPEAIQTALELHVDHISEQSSQEAILYEILLKSGFELTTSITKLSIDEKTVFSIAEGQMLICLEKELTNELIKQIAEQKPVRVVCLDEGFQNNDQLKSNAVQIMKSKGVVKFQTV